MLVNPQDWNKYNKKIHHLEDFDFKNKIFLPSKQKPNDVFIITVSAPWCGHCKTLKPKLIEAAQNLHPNEGIHFALLEIAHQKPEDMKDFSKNEQNLINQMKTNPVFDFEGFPTIFKVVNGKTTKYEGQREVEDLLQFARF